MTERLARAVRIGLLPIAGVLLLGAQDAQEAARPAGLRVSVEATPPIWIAGHPLGVTLVFENRDDVVRRIPASWTLGSGLELREVRQGAHGRPAPGGDREPQVVPALRGVSVPADLPADWPLPPHGRLEVSLELRSIEPPPGDAFDLIFRATDPPAVCTEARVERVEDLTGAHAVLETDLGRMVLALDVRAAPLALRNFVKLAESKFYDGVSFHRVEKGLYVQAGDPESKSGDPASFPGNQGMTFDQRPIPLERSRAVFERGTVGLARVPDEVYRQFRAALAQLYEAADDADLDAKLRKHWPSAAVLDESRAALASGGSQFFICTASAPHFQNRYAAFAKVVEGLDVLSAIEGLEVLGGQAASPHLRERPVRAVRIRSVRIVRDGSARTPPPSPVPSAPATQK